MPSVASAGAAARIAARTLHRVVRAGSGTLAKYSSTPSTAPLLFIADRVSCAGAEVDVVYPDEAKRLSDVVHHRQYRNLGTPAFHQFERRAQGRMRTDRDWAGRHRVRRGERTDIVVGC